MENREVKSSSSSRNHSNCLPSNSVLNHVEALRVPTRLPTSRYFLQASYCLRDVDWCSHGKIIQIHRDIEPTLGTCDSTSDTKGPETRTGRTEVSNWHAPYEQCNLSPQTATERGNHLDFARAHSPWIQSDTKTLSLISLFLSLHTS